jgi:endoribonuclease Dicer
MNDFYCITESMLRPKILAMATMHPDRKFHFDSGMLKLENTLDAKVFGISGDQRTEILSLPDRPNELVVLYDPPLRTMETRLFRELRQYDQNEVLFRRQFGAARHTLVEVGSCASDLIWRRALKEIEDSVPPLYEEDEDSNDQSGMSPARRKARIRDIVKNWAFAMPNLHSGSRGFNITPKFLKLIKVLKSCQPYGDSFRGIVFGRSIGEILSAGHNNLNPTTVQRRATAQVLVDLIRTLGDHLGFIRPIAVVDHRTPASSGHVS